MQKKIKRGALALPLVLFAMSSNAQVKQKLNFLYIFPDQYRSQAMSFWDDPEFKGALRTKQDPVETPAIDLLAHQGVVFTNCTSVHPVSSPHRAMLMSGMYPHQNGVEDLNCYMGRTQGLHDNIVCFTDVLAKAGYETAYVGKTHWERTEPLFDKEGNYVGTAKAPGGHYANPFDTYIPAGPGRHSNKFWFQHVKDSHMDAWSYSNQPNLVNGKKDGDMCDRPGFTPQIEADIIIDYLKNTVNQRDTSKPFSLFWGINPPHPPYQSPKYCPQEYYQFYKNMPLEQLLVRPNVDISKRPEIEMNARVYFSLVRGVDHEIGRVIDTLKDLGLDENTVVVFSSDHGEMMGSFGATGKNKIQEESFVVPFIVRAPKLFKPRLEDLQISTVDIMPTFLDLLGLKDMIPESVEGEDYADGLLSGNYQGKKPISALFLNMNCKGVRTERYSYRVDKEGTYAIYDNIKDPYQLHTLKLSEIPQSKAKLLQSELGKWLAKANDSWASKKLHPNLIKY